MDKDQTPFSVIKNNFANLAYTNWDDDINEFKDCLSIDLLKTPIENLEIIGFPNLKRFRAQRCDNLESIKIVNCPNLEVIDVSFCHNLDKATFDHLPSLRCMDISFTSIITINNTESFPNLQYLLTKNVSLSYFRQDDAPNLIALEQGNATYEDYERILTFTKLERLFISFTFSKKFSLSKFARMPNLKYLNIKRGKENVDDFPKKTALEVLIFDGSSNSNIFKLPIKYILLNRKCMVLPPFPTKEEDWLDAYRLIYGPWGIPMCDQVAEPVVSGITPPVSITSDVLDSMMGAVFASALGDSLGVGAEFNCSTTLAYLLQCPLDVAWSHVFYSSKTPTFMLGDSTDDTDQSVFIMRSLKSGKPNVLDFAFYMEQWSNHGIVEHKHGTCYDIGTTTAVAVNHPLFRKDPITAAHEVMNSSTVGNGSAMRTASVGCYMFWDEEVVKETASLFSRTTHAMPCCVFGAVLISLLVSRFIQKRCGMIKEVDIEATVKECLKYAKADDHEYLHKTKIEDLDCDGRNSGFVIKSVGVALVCLRNDWSYEESMTRVIRAGGDADTNAAIAGAVLGAKFGFSSIPERLIKYLFNGSWIYKDFAQMLAAIGIKPPESPFNRLAYL